MPVNAYHFKGINIVSIFTPVIFDHSLNYDVHSLLTRTFISIRIQIVSLSHTLAPLPNSNSSNTHSDMYVHAHTHTYRIKGV